MVELLEVTVWDADEFSNDKCLGVVEIDIAEDVAKVPGGRIYKTWYLQVRTSILELPADSPAGQGLGTAVRQPSQQECCPCMWIGIAQTGSGMWQHPENYIRICKCSPSYRLTVWLPLSGCIDTRQLCDTCDGLLLHACNTGLCGCDLLTMIAGCLPVPAAHSNGMWRALWCASGIPSHACADCI